MTMNEKIVRPLIPGETPSKGMEVVIWTPKQGDNQDYEELVTWEPTFLASCPTSGRR